jgi:hypothetical protein
VTNGAIAQQTFEAFAAYVLPQLHNILAHSNPRPFAGNLEGHEDGANEDMMTGDLLYPNALYPTINSAQQQLYPTQYHDLTIRFCYPISPGAFPNSQPYLPPPPGLGFHPNPTTPWPMQFTPTHLPQSPAPASSDKAGTRQRKQEARKTRQQNTTEREDGHP